MTVFTTLLNYASPMLNYVSPIASYLFPTVRVLKLFKRGTKILNTTNPVIITANVTLTVLDCCTPPPVRLIGHCVGTGALIAVSVIAPNPYTYSASVHLVEELMGECSSSNWKIF